ncbi:MAG: lysophospholipid acyltransferase family protein [Phycisphaerales bacterium]|nr:lysophospholipid acyltransferase family protein [Phycisphaerales bacterium]MCB9856866.1 lysophospholipid acyltransferase family protein [Phycisphaerales bacterium]MCB9862007.1 lysophospholipid acyltransferase family protein [Phycisphaerales bacterium]
METDQARPDQERSDAVDDPADGAREHGDAPDAAPGILSIQEHPVPFLTLLRIRFVRFLLVAVQRCLTLTGLYMLGCAFALGEYIVDFRRRRRVHRKLSDYFKNDATPKFRRRYAIRYFMRVRCDKMFYTIMDRIPRTKIENRIELTGIQNIDDGLEQGRGVYVALCHFGSHHIAGLLMALLGYELAGVRDGKESAVRRYIQNRYTETFPEIRRMKMFAANSFPRGIYRHLQQNKIVASLLDADRKRGQRTKTESVRLFGEERDVLVGPLQIAIRCNAVILQGFIVSKPYYRYEVVVTPPLIDRQPDADEPAVIREIVKQYAAGVEDFARNNPDHLMNI